MIQPIRDNILVKPFDADNVSDGGIIVPDSVKKPSNKVMIVAVGNGTVKKPMKLRTGVVGYRVQDWGMEVVCEGELYYLINQDAILATN